jgi:hypothetical protein
MNVKTLALLLNFILAVGILVAYVIMTTDGYDASVLLGVLGGQGAAGGINALANSATVGAPKE